MNKDGTISYKVKPLTDSRVRKFGKMGESIDQLINRLLDMVEKKKQKEAA